MAGVRLLLVDDSEENHVLMRMLLEPRGFEVRTAISVAEALDALRASRPHIVLSDWRMEHADAGARLLSAVASDDTLRGVPVVVCSAHADEEHRARALEMGAAAYVTKPFVTDDLVGILIRLASR